MPATANPVTLQQYLVTIKGIDSYWTKFSGIEDSADTTEYNNGLTNRKSQLVGPRMLANMDLEKAFDPIADKPIVDWWRAYCDRNAEALTISITPVTYCPEVEPLGPSVIIYGCRPIKLKGFEVDKNSANVAPLMLTFIGDDWEYS